MTAPALRRISLYVLSLGVAACGAGDHSPSRPTSIEAAKPTVVTPGSTGITMPVTSQGTKPAGFEASVRVDPHPNKDGIIVGDSALSVRFNACHSKSGSDRELFYLFDWDSDHLADAAGTGEACEQEHKYDVRRFPDARGHVLFETNVCVVSGDPRRPGPETYFSCRTFRINLTVPVVKECGHSLCTVGPALKPGCNGCVASICAQDPFCCNLPSPTADAKAAFRAGSWDGKCISEVYSICNSTQCGPN